MANFLLFMLSALKVEDGRTQRYFGNKVLLVGLEDGNILLQDSCTRQSNHSFHTEIFNDKKIIIKTINAECIK